VATAAGARARSAVPS